mmetsp:Transcript_15234/g.38447  ORF Transcript_15234/g.38447 Transcript_15234/m.38447 type:complete len:267 (-) Transcript_15234:516-1316(-)
MRVESTVYCFEAQKTAGYPFDPPKVKFFHLGKGEQRINPNLYVCGKVCLSILGTWSGPSWTSTMTIESLASSIQSILIQEPLRNEPGYETVPVSQCMEYNKMVIDVVKKYFIGHLPPEIKNEGAKAFARSVWNRGSQTKNEGRPIGRDAYAYVHPEGGFVLLIAGPAQSSYQNGVFCFKTDPEKQATHFLSTAKSELPLHPFFPADDQQPSRLCWHPKCCRQEGVRGCRCWLYSKLFRYGSRRKTFPRHLEVCKESLCKEVTSDGR